MQSEQLLIDLSGPPVTTTTINSNPFNLIGNDMNVSPKTNPFFDVKPNQGSNNPFVTNPIQTYPIETNQPKNNPFTNSNPFNQEQSSNNPFLDSKRIEDVSFFN